MSVHLQGVANISPIFQKEASNQIQNDNNSTINFSSLLKNAIGKVNEAEQASNLKTEALAEGNVNDLHDVMITAQKASITVETAVQVQQKAIDIYNEMMRMQV